MKIRSKRMLRLLARSMAAGCRLLFMTVRSELIETYAGTSPYDGNRKQRFLYCIWHDNILGPTFCGRSVKMAALTSLHGDGAFVAMALECVGITPIRGSSSRRGSRFTEMMDARDMDITIATDGPRGPRREVKQGSSISHRRPVVRSSRLRLLPPGPGTSRVAGPICSCPSRFQRSG
ncbi:MAG: DUF374 domain-containing protein [Planctomycetaceae bacterium]